METPQSGQPTTEINGNVLFYSKPEPLNYAAHGKLGVKQISQPFGFMRSAHAVPLTITEFGMAATSYPIIFIGEDKTPIAVMGVRQGENLYVTEDGRTEPNYYIPAFVRRYPFVFANDDQRDQLLLCVDTKAEMISDNPDVAFFDGEEPSKFTNDAIEFCKEFERQRRATLNFRDLMQKYDLFEQKSISFQPRDAQGQEAGAPQKIADYWAVSEAKLNELSVESFDELRKAGALAAIYAHLISILLWPRIIQRALKGAAANATATPQA